jgi:hypothetical protein
MQARHCCERKWAAVDTGAGSSHHNPTRRKKTLGETKIQRSEQSRSWDKNKDKNKKKPSSVQFSTACEKTTKNLIKRERERDLWGVGGDGLLVLLYLQRSLSFPPPLLFLQLPFMTTIMGVLLILLLKISTATFVFNLVYLQPHLTPPQQQIQLSSGACLPDWHHPILISFFLFSLSLSHIYCSISFTCFSFFSLRFCKLQLNSSFLKLFLIYHIFKL